MRRMRTRLIIVALASCLVQSAFGMGNDDPLLAKLMVDKAEYRKTSGHDHLAWEADAWLGRDIDKLWLKTEGENSEDRVEEAELQLLYSRAITTNWNFQAGWRGEFRPNPERNWLAAGFRGIAPYHFDIDVAAFVGESGRTSARVDVDYEILFSQRLILSPEVELDWYGKDDPARFVGSGFSSLELGLRLRYEIRREFAPFIGINWWGKLGDTRDIARAAGNETSDLELVLGIRAWF